MVLEYYRKEISLLFSRDRCQILKIQETMIFFIKSIILFYYLIVEIKKFLLPYLSTNCSTCKLLFKKFFIIWCRTFLINQGLKNFEH